MRKATQVSKAYQVSNAPQVIKAPQESKASQVSEAPQASKVPQGSKASQMRKASPVGKVPQVNSMGLRCIYCFLRKQNIAGFSSSILTAAPITALFGNARISILAKFQSKVTVQLE